LQRRLVRVVDLGEIEPKTVALSSGYGAAGAILRRIGVMTWS
jgi:hypothetical protein